MKRYLYKLNRPFFISFERNIYNRFKTFNTRSFTNFFKCILQEINELFLKIGRRVSSKKDIMSENEYPDSSKHNKLITNIGYDLDKLFSGQQLIEDDVTNLVNYNQNQVERITNLFMRVQNSVYSSYIKAKKDIGGKVEIPGDNPFLHNSVASKESTNILIDESRKVLTLGVQQSSILKPIDTDNTVVYVVSNNNIVRYPKNNVLWPGSHWKCSGNDPHFQDTANPGIASSYKTMMIDDPLNPVGVGFCEFESVATGSKVLSIRYMDIVNSYIPEKNGRSNPSHLPTNIDPDKLLCGYIGRLFNKDASFIFLDKENSIQGQYLGDITNLININKFKLSIPFKGTINRTNEIQISFSSNNNTYGRYPKIFWKESKVFSGTNNYDLLSPNDSVPIDGVYKCVFASYIVPSRIELVLGYDGCLDDYWPYIKFMMSHYIYNNQKTYTLPQPMNLSNRDLTVTLRTAYNIFVDAEPDTLGEEQRAINVIRNK